jgi:hypothetical protein
MKEPHVNRLVPSPEEGGRLRALSTATGGMGPESCFRLAREGRTLIPWRPAPKHAQSAVFS